MKSFKYTYETIENAAVFKRLNRFAKVLYSVAVVTVIEKIKGKIGLHERIQLGLVENILPD